MYPRRTLKWPQPREATTMADVAYLPSGFRTVRKAVRGLAKQKKKWAITLHEEEKGTKVFFDESFSIYVPKECWHDFEMMFDEPLHGGTVDLTKYLNEAEKDTTRERLAEIKPAIARLLDKKSFQHIERSVAEWKKHFGVRNAGAYNCLLSVENKMSGINQLGDQVAKHYGRDLGNLEILLDALAHQKPLNSFKVFKDYPYIYGARVASRFEGIDLIYEGSVDMAYLPSESIAINDFDILEKVEDDNTSVKVVKNVIYPRQGSFRPEFFGYLADAISTDESGDKDE